MASAYQGRVLTPGEVEQVAAWLADGESSVPSCIWDIVPMTLDISPPLGGRYGASPGYLPPNGAAISIRLLGGLAVDIPFRSWGRLTFPHGRWDDLISLLAHEDRDTRLQGVELAKASGVSVSWYPGHLSEVWRINHLEKCWVNGFAGDCVEKVHRSERGQWVRRSEWEGAE